MGEGEVGKVPIRQKIKGKRHSGAWGSTKEKMKIKRKVKFRGECPQQSWVKTRREWVETSRYDWGKFRD